MKHIKTIIFFFLFVNVLQAQNTNRVFKKGSLLDKNNLKLEVSGGFYLLKFLNSKIVETSFIPSGENPIDKSHAVILKPNGISTKFSEDDTHIKFKTKELSVYIQKSPFKLSYYYRNNEITSEKQGYYKSKHIPLELVKGNIQYNETEKNQFNLTKEEVLFGGGARALDMNRRGNRLALYNRAHYGYETQSELMNFTIPMVISSKKYIIHFDNTAVGYLDLDSRQDNSLTYETISGKKTYQVVVGDSWEELINNYTDLTGKQPLPPRWILGNFSSRFGYHSQNETEQTIQKFKDDKIPVDAVILDLYWFGKSIKGTMGNLEVHKDSFPNIRKMISDFKKEGVKTVLITEPFVLSSSKKWNEAIEKNILAKDTLNNPATYDFYFGNTGIVDIYKKEGKDWFWSIYKGLLDDGVKGLWGDLGEPEVLPSWVRFENAKADEIHNIYGHNWAELIYEGYKKDFPNERPFILMRAGYSGSQRFGMIPWSGDVNRTWGGLQSQPKISLQMGMQGLGYMHSDLGGFAGANLDNNLYVRWLQYGVFQPIYRPHAQEEVASEPVYKDSDTKELAKKAIELRYRMLPYNYNLAFENNQKGTPLMRPIFFEDDNMNLIQNSSTYLWGKDFLIAPILKDSVQLKEMYFPKTSNWFSFYTDEKVDGGQTKSVKVEEESIPTYVRGGVIIPFTKINQTTDDYKGNNLELHYYFDESVTQSKRTVYNDDGLTSNTYEKGEYELMKFTTKLSENYLEIILENDFGEKWNPEQKDINLILHNISWNPQKIKVGNKKIKDSTENNKLIIPVKWESRKKLKIKISLK